MDINLIDWEKVNGLIPVIVQNYFNGNVLMLGYMNKEALIKTLSENKITFFSRTKNRLWTKGESSGNYLNLKELFLDCDNDALLAKVDPIGPTCHRGTYSCFSVDDSNFTFLDKLEKIIDERIFSDNNDSYVKKIYEKGIYRISQKIGEEGVEVALAGVKGDSNEIISEGADLIFHLLVLLRYYNLSFDDLVKELISRNKKSF